MNPNIKITPLSADQAIREWDVISGIMEKVLSHSLGRFTMEDSKKRVASGMALPILVWDPEAKQVYAVLIAEAADYPLKKVFSISLLAGEQMEEWVHLWPAVKDLARSMGYDQVEVQGRAGWAKFVPGAKEVARIWVEELNSVE